MFINRDVTKILAFRQRKEDSGEKPTALCMQGFIDSIKKMGGHIPLERNATGKWMLWRVNLTHRRVKARLPFTVKSMVQFTLHPGSENGGLSMVIRDGEWW
uniref:Uncharacterized protein n=1 Tax=Tanacetum cinerariifolium TaxID=118510 RepID=A0A699HZN3_TANCI|nr:hypothetical protein [Tanacetum cinerariifolium]